MKAVRLIIEQSQANFKMEETVENRMTYPLPPFSTVYGAISAACSWDEYHECKISVQGDFKTKTKEYVMHNSYLNSTMDDRGTLIKAANPNIFGQAYIKVAKVNRGGSLKNKENLIVYNNDLLEEYLKLRERQTKNVNERKELNKLLKELKENVEKSNEKMKLLKAENEGLKNKLSYFKSIESVPTYIETLYDLTMVMHIHSDDETMREILENVNQIKSIGRSEDFVNVKSAELVELNQKDKDIKSKYHAYVNKRDIIDGNICEYTEEEGNKKISGGTIFYVNKYYEMVNEKRIFEKIPCLWVSHYTIKKYSPSIWSDGEYILNFN